MRRKPKPFEPCQREKRGVGLSVAELFEPGLDIAAEIGGPSAKEVLSDWLYEQTVPPRP